MRRKKSVCSDASSCTWSWVESRGHWKMCQWHCAMTAESRRAASAIYSLISSFLQCIKALVISLSLSAVLNLSGLRNATAVCCALVYSPPVMLNFASHLTRMQDSVLQSVTLWCSEVILKFPFIALFLISFFPAGVIGGHNEVIQLYSMDLQHVKLCVYSLPWNVWLDVHFKSMLCCWFLIAWKATGTRWPWGGVGEWHRHLAVGGATNLGKASSS